MTRKHFLQGGKELSCSAARLSPMRARCFAMEKDSHTCGTFGPAWTWGWGTAGATQRTSSIPLPTQRHIEASASARSPFFVSSSAKQQIPLTFLDTVVTTKARHNRSPPPPLPSVVRSLPLTRKWPRVTRAGEGTGRTRMKAANASSSFGAATQTASNIQGGTKLIASIAKKN